MVVAEELPRRSVSEVQLAGHDGVVSQRWTFPYAGFVELGACPLEADFPGGYRVAVERHRLLPLPKQMFESRRITDGTADSQSLVRFDTNVYSVPVQ